MEEIITNEPALAANARYRRGMRAMLALAAIGLLGLACAGSSPDGAAAPEPRVEPTSARDADAAATAEDDASSPPLTAQDCAELIAHIVDIAVREDGLDNPSLPPPTEEEISAMHDALRHELEDRCVGRDRGVYDCAMRAETRDELAACDDPD